MIFNAVVGLLLFISNPVRGFVPPNSPTFTNQSPWTIQQKNNGDVSLKMDLTETAVPLILFGAGFVATISEDKSPGSISNNMESVIEKAKSDTPAEAEKTNPPPVPAKPAPAPVPDITPIKLEVASTIQEEKEKIERLKEEEKDEGIGGEEPVEEDQSGNEDGDDDAKSGKSRLIVRILKKIVMPWRKWSNL